MFTSHSHTAPMYLIFLLSLVFVYSYGALIQSKTTDDIVHNRPTRQPIIGRRLTTGDKPLKETAVRAPLRRSNCVTGKLISNKILKEKRSFVEDSKNFSRTMKQKISSISLPETFTNIVPHKKRSFNSHIKSLQDLPEPFMDKKHFSDFQLIKDILESVLKTKPRGFLRINGSDKRVTDALEIYFANVLSGKMMFSTYELGQLNEIDKASLLKKLMATQSQEGSFLTIEESLKLRTLLDRYFLLPKREKAAKIGKALKSIIPSYKCLLLETFVDNMSQIIRLPGYQLDAKSVLLSFPSFSFPDPSIVDAMKVSALQSKFSTQMSPIFEFPEEFSKGILSK